MAGFLAGAAQAASGLKAQAQRLRLVAENIANADTPGYRRKTTTFETVVRDGRDTGQVRTGRVSLDQSPRERSTTPAIHWPTKTASTTAPTSIWWSRSLTRAKRSAATRRT